MDSPSFNAAFIFPRAMGCLNTGAQKMSSKLLFFFFLFKNDISILMLILNSGKRVFLFAAELSCNEK